MNVSDADNHHRKCQETAQRFPGSKELLSCKSSRESPYKILLDLVISAFLVQYIYIHLCV